MDSGRSRGDFESAYKLSRANVDGRTKRRERRSIEQKETRHIGLNKRRNLQDLSPLQEGEQTIDDGYHGKTPVKPVNGIEIICKSLF